MPRARSAIGPLVGIGLAIGGCGLLGPSSAVPPSLESSPNEPPATGIALPPAWTETPSPTTAPPTVAPTATPPFGLEWATPVPVDAEYDGWVRLESRNATLWLPPGFEVLDLGGFADLMAMMAYAMTDAMSQMASSIAPPSPGEPVPTLVSLEELQAAFVFDFVLAADETEQAALFLVGEPPDPEIDLGLAIQGVLDGFKNEFTVDSQHAITDRAFPMARLILSTVSEDDASPLKNLVYVFVRDGRAWSLNYGAPAERFATLLPAFEKSAASFELIE